MNRQTLLLRSYLKMIKPNRLLSNKAELSENEPVKFSTSPAARKLMKPIVKATNVNIPWYQPFSIVGSLAILLLYFCVLREENDIDVEFSRTLYERIKGLEKQQLLLSYKHNKENGKSVAEIEQRLREIEVEEAKEKTALA